LRQSDLVWCLENSDKSLGSNATTIHHMVKMVDSKNLRITYDACNFVLAQRDPLIAYETMNEYVHYIHLKDVKSDAANTTFLGDGDMDYPVLFAAMVKHEYSGYACFEFPMKVDAIADIEASIAYVQKTWHRHSSIN
jgi:sugar phosphate isomerase/epimerase